MLLLRATEQADSSQLTNRDHLGLAGAAFGEESLDGAEHVFLESRGAPETRRTAKVSRIQLH
jgi:hypothetical protein